MMLISAVPRGAASSAALLGSAGERAKKFWTLVNNRLILEWNTLIVAHLGSLRSRCWVVD